MSGPGSGTPDSGFQDRLNRMQERRAPIEAARPKVDVLPDWKANIRYPATLVGMAFLGMFAVFFARFVRFHLLGGTLAGDAPDITMMIDAGIAAVAGVMIYAAVGLSMRDANRAERGSMFSLDGLSDNPVKAALVVGIAIMIGTMHNMVHSMPSAFNLLFSEEWTEDIVTYSEPGSIYFRGNYFVVLPQSEATAADEAESGEGEKKALPKVRRL
ncbi:MAG: hypothetical protein KJN60_13945 [Boseongicola sp.]|nr:hypothetical protein [Boseongicola sp.]